MRRSFGVSVVGRVPSGRIHLPGGGLPEGPEWPAPLVPAQNAVTPSLPLSGRRHLFRSLHFRVCLAAPPCLPTTTPQLDLQTLATGPALSHRCAEQVTTTGRRGGWPSGTRDQEVLGPRFPLCWPRRRGCAQHGPARPGDSEAGAPGDVPGLRVNPDARERLLEPKDKGRGFLPGDS